MTSRPAPPRPVERVFVRGAKQIVTLQGRSGMRTGRELFQIGLLRDASILIEDGIITEVGSTRRLDNLKQTSGARLVDARNLVIVPGFLDAVHHLLPFPSSDAEQDTLPDPTLRPDDTDAGDILASFSSHSSRVHTWHNVTRRLERQLRRLHRTGSSFVQFRLSMPSAAAERSRILRSLLQMELPRGVYRAEIHFQTLPEGLADGVGFEQQLPGAARALWKRLQPSLALSIHAAALVGHEGGAQARAIGLLRGNLQCFLTSPQLLSARELHDLCIGSGCIPVGVPSAAKEVWNGSPWREVPWILPAGEWDKEAHHHQVRLRRALDSGMRLALSSGFDVNQRGYSSPCAAWARLRQVEQIAPEELLQISIANLACALGVSERLGTIQAGREGNLTLFDCDDYRELGVHSGFPPVAAIFRRGVLVERRLPTRE